MEKIDSQPISNEYESVLAIPMFSYLIILDEQRNNIFSHSFDFESDEQCETFGFRFTKNISTRVIELNFLLDLIQKLLISMANEEIVDGNSFIDFNLQTQYFCLLQFHGFYFIAVYSEADNKISNLQKEFIQGSLRGIATTFLALNDPISTKNQLSDESLSAFVNAIPVLLSQTPREEDSIRNCILCPPEKYCIPKLLLKNIEPDYRATSIS